MIQKFVDRFMEKKSILENWLKSKHPENYEELVKKVIKILHEGCNDPDPLKIHVIDDGDYQGKLLFMIPEERYQPSNYFYVFVDYGSCSGCDTLQSIRDYDSDPPTELQIEDYMTLALHIVQGMKELKPEILKV